MSASLAIKCKRAQSVEVPIAQCNYIKQKTNKQNFLKKITTATQSFVVCTFVKTIIGYKRLVTLCRFAGQKESRRKARERRSVVMVTYSRDSIILAPFWEILALTKLSVFSTNVLKKVLNLYVAF